MSEPMPKPKYPHVHKETNRHGKPAWYLRVNRGRRIRLTAPYGSPEFEKQYFDAMAGKTDQPEKAREGTLEWLVERYRDSGAWAKLSNATRRQRENILRQILAKAGKERWSAINRKSIIASIEARSKTPYQARHFFDTMAGLFKWAVAADIAKVNPTLDIELPETPRSEGFPVWTDEDIDRFEKKWPLGTRERLALDLLLYTGLRRGDAVMVGRHNVRDGEIVLKTQKTGTEVTIPILPELQASIDAAPTGDLIYIVGEKGKPMTKESFGNWFRDACRGAGVKKSAHGLRKAGATRAANNGATVAQLEAIFGWKGGGMASLYTRAADRRRLARDAISKLSKNASSTSVARTFGKSAGARAKTGGKSNG